MNWTILLSITCLGISAIVTQIITLREFLTVFAGNELIIGIVLGNWLLLTGLGSYLGRFTVRLKQPLTWLIIAQIGIALLPPAQFAFIRLLKTTFIPGIVPGILDAFLSSLILLLPYCLLSGLLLTLFSSLASQKKDAAQIGTVYAIDSLGDIFGGLLFSFLLVYFFTPMQTAFLLLILNLIAAALLASFNKRKILTIPTVLILIGSIFFSGFYNLEQITTRALYPGFELIEQNYTPYGNLGVVKKGQQISIYENGTPISSTDSIQSAEEIVHYPLSQRPHPQKVLLISGGLTGAVQEILKHDIKRVDYVELDPAIIAYADKYAGLAGIKQLHTIAGDARQYLFETREKYDAILIDLPGPLSAQLNRFYTTEFFTRAQNVLNPEGVIALSISGAANYVSQQERKLNASIYKSLSQSFSHIIIIPGDHNYFVASNQSLSYNIAQLLLEESIKTTYVNQGYLKARLSPDRIQQATAMLKTPSRINQDLHPVGYEMQLKYWLSWSKTNYTVPLILFAGLVIFLLMLLASSRRPVVHTTILTSGFSGLGLEMVLLIAFQIFYGYVYKQIGIMITLFLTGTVLGALWANRKKQISAHTLFRLDTMIAVYAFLLAPLLSGMSHTSPAWSEYLVQVFPLLNGIVGFLIGAQFPIAARLNFDGIEKTAAGLYTFDLIGASLGAILISALCIPVFGITGTCYLLGGIKIINTAFLSRNLKTTDFADTTIQRRNAMAAFGATLIVFVVMGTMIVSDKTSIEIYAFSFSAFYQWFVVLLLAAGLFFASGGRFSPPFFTRLDQAVYKKTRITLIRWINYLGFVLIAIFPIFRCYFKVPYLFCHVCPRKCIFGYFRPYLVPAALIMNLDNRYWCQKCCPIGTLYHCQSISGGKSRKLPWYLKLLPLLVLIFTAVSYFKIKWDYENTGNTIHDWYTYFLNNSYAVSTMVIAIAVILIILGFSLRRSFCSLICPLGAFSDLVAGGEKKYLDNNGDARVAQK